MVSQRARGVALAFVGLYSTGPVRGLDLPAMTPPLLGLDLYRPVPEAYPLTPAAVSLGRRLFFDPILSRDRSLSCTTCHDPEESFTDGRVVSMGIDQRLGRRNVPTLSIASTARAISGMAAPRASSCRR